MSGPEKKVYLASLTKNQLIAIIKEIVRHEGDKVAARSLHKLMVEWATEDLKTLEAKARQAFNNREYTKADDLWLTHGAAHKSLCRLIYSGIVFK